MVYVLSIEGKPLMPTKRHGKVRRLMNGIEDVGYIHRKGNYRVLEILG